jgi:hypothetical protein
MPFTALTLTVCAPLESNKSAQILLFNGAGTSPNEVKAVEAILMNVRLVYRVRISVMFVRKIDNPVSA